MNSALLDCKKKAQLMAQLNDPAVSEGGRKKGYMEVMGICGTVWVMEVLR